MNKKFLTLFLINLFLLSSCKEKNVEETPTPEISEWKFSSTMHWKEINGEKKERATHQFGDWITNLEATCLEDGSRYKECSVCHFKKEETVPKTGHNYGSWINEGESSYRVCLNCDDVQSTIREESIILSNPFNGETIDLCEPVIRDLIDHKNDDGYVATHHMKYRAYSSGKTYDNQKFIDISFVDSKNRNDVTYTLTLAEDNEFKNIVDTYNTSSKSIRLEGILIPNKTYFYKIDVSDGDYSPIDSFVTLNSPIRWISAGGVKNVRDLGGYEAENGKHVKYGLVYRGAGLGDSVSSFDKKGRDVFSKLNMKGEIDLRENASTVNAWNPSYPHICVNGGWYTDLIANTAKIEALKYSLNFLANENNYPTYFHCSFGMDRTGTLSYFLLSLLGVNEKDVYLDYELTDYSSVAGTKDSHCERAVISEISEGQYTFDYNASSYSDGTALRTPVYKCLQMVKENYPAGSLQESVSKYLIQKVGVSQNTIDKLKNNLLE